MTRWMITALICIVLIGVRWPTIRFLDGRGEPPDSMTKRIVSWFEEQPSLNLTPKVARCDRSASLAFRVQIVAPGRAIQAFSFRFPN